MLASVTKISPLLFTIAMVLGLGLVLVFFIFYSQWVIPIIFMCIGIGIVYIQRSQTPVLSEGPSLIGSALVVVVMLALGIVFTQVVPLVPEWLSAARLAGFNLPPMLASDVNAYLTIGFILIFVMLMAFYAYKGGVFKR